MSFRISLDNNIKKMEISLTNVLDVYSGNKTFEGNYERKNL